MRMFSWQLLAPAGCTLCSLSPAVAPSPLCPACEQELPWYQQPYDLAQLRVQAACHYQYPLDRLIQLFKHQQRLDLLPLLNYCLRQLHKPDADAIIPMPISSQRLKQRGFNQSLLLARALAGHWQLPVWQPVAKQHRPPQQGLSRAERLVNLEGAFYALPAQASRLNNKKLLILDDVMTTGSSLLLLSDTLLAMGALQVEAACLAIAEL